MWFFWDVLDVAVDITTRKVKFGAKIADSVLDTDFDWALEEVKDTIKMKK